MYVCVYVCVYVRHAQKIAKLFLNVRSTQFPFKLIILFIEIYINLLGPKTLRSQEVQTLGLCLEYETFIRGVFCPNLFVLEN